MLRNIDSIRGYGGATGIVRVNVTAKGDDAGAGDDDGLAPRCEAPYVVTEKARLRERVVGPQQPRRAEDEGLQKAVGEAAGEGTEIIVRCTHYTHSAAHAA